MPNPFWQPTEEIILCVMFSYDADKVFVEDIIFVLILVIVVVVIVVSILVIVVQICVFHGDKHLVLNELLLLFLWVFDNHCLLPFCLYGAKYEQY